MVCNLGDNPPYVINPSWINLLLFCSLRPESNQKPMDIHHVGTCLVLPLSVHLQAFTRACKGNFKSRGDYLGAFDDLKSRGDYLGAFDDLEMKNRKMDTP